MNLIDLLLVFFIALFAYRGYRRGIIAEGIDLVGFLLSVLLAVRLYPVIGVPLSWIGIGRGPANFIGGLIIFAGLVVGAAIFSRRIHRRVGQASLTENRRIGGAVVGGLWSALLGTFLLVFVTVIPTPGMVQRAVPRSLMGHTVLSADSPVYLVMDRYARSDARNLVFFVRQYLARFESDKEPPEPDKCFDIQSSDAIDPDEEAETLILQMVNKERTSRGLTALKQHNGMRRVARGHSADMYRNGYFCHTNLRLQDPFDRMAAGDVRYGVAGENLALAPTTEMVHRGLMNSPLHKENILRSDFTDLGIGVYKGPYGLMVTQNFCGDCRG